MRKYKNYILLGILIIVLLVGVFVITGINPETTENDDDYEMTEIYSVLSEDIVSVEIKNAYGEYTVLNGDAVTVKDKKADLDIEKLKYLFTEVSSLYASEIVSAENTDVNQFGFDNPEGIAVINLKNSEAVNVFIGIKTPTLSGRYLKIGNSDKVYIVSENSSDVFLRKLDYYRNTVLFSMDILNINALEFTKSGRKVAFVRNDETDLNRNTFASFNMVTPYSWDADSAELEKIITLMNQLKIKEYVEDNPGNLSLYGLQSPLANIIITNKDGSKNSLYIGKNKDSDIYITANGKPNVYLIDGAGFEFLGFEPNAFLQQFVSLRLIDQVAKFKYTHNDINMEFEIKKIDLETHDVKVNGKMVDEKSFKELYTEIISMSTGGALCDTPKGNPILSYEFTYLNGETEIFKFYKYDERKIAVVTEGATIFYVDSSQFEKKVTTIDSIIKNNF